MIELGPQVALLMGGVVAVSAASWASWVSVQSAGRGPAWALDHFRAAGRTAALGSLLLVPMVLLVRPLWVGLVALYVVLAVAVLARMAARHLLRLAVAGGLEPLAPDRIDAVVVAAKRWLVIGGAVLIGGAGWWIEVGGGPAVWIVAAVGAVMAGNGLAIARPSADRHPMNRA